MFKNEIYTFRVTVFDRCDTGQENSMMYYNSSRDKIRCEQNGSKNNKFIKYTYMFTPNEIPAGPAICSLIHQSFNGSGIISALEGLR